MLSHEGISNSQSSHGLDDGNRARSNVRVVAALGGQDTLARSVVAGGSLVLGNRRGGLEGNAEEDGHAVRDAALDTAGVVRLGLQAGGRDAWASAGAWLRVVGGGARHEGVVVAGSAHLGAAETRANLKSFSSRDRHNGVGQESLKLVEAWLAEARGAPANNTGYGTTSRVVLVAELGNFVLHALRNSSVRAADGEELIDLLAGEGVNKLQELGVAAKGIDVVAIGQRSVLEELDVANGRNKGNDLDAVGLAQPFLGNSTGSNAGNGLAGTASATARGGFDTILLKVSPVSVRGAGVEVDGLGAVVVRALILVGHGQENRCAQSAILLH